jgi:hypothetical protein
MRSDKEIWREFLDFRIEECVGLWSKFAVTFPFGRMIELHPDDGPCMIMDADLERFKPEEVLAETEDFVARYNHRCGFQFSTAWKGDVAGFQALLRENGYQPVTAFLWMIKDDFSNIDALPESEFLIDRAPDSATVKYLFRRTLNPSEGVAERLKQRLDRVDGSIKGGFIVARTKSGLPVALSGYSYEGNLGHSHSQGTLPEHRRAGAAWHMAKVRYQILRDVGVKTVVAFVIKRNMPPIEYAKSIGMRVFEETPVWAKPRAR